jgi:hypothetical protein
MITMAMAFAPLHKTIIIRKMPKWFSKSYPDFLG